MNRWQVAVGFSPIAMAIPPTESHVERRSQPIIAVNVCADLVEGSSRARRRSRSVVSTANWKGVFSQLPNCRG